MALRTGPHMEASDRLQAIKEDASSMPCYSDTPIKYYFKAGWNAARNAARYEEDGQIENAFFLYFRVLTVFLDKLRHHPELKQVPPSDRKTMYDDLCNKVKARTEILEPKLLEQFREEHEEYLDRAKLRKKVEGWVAEAMGQDENNKQDGDDKRTTSSPDPESESGHLVPSKDDRRNSKLSMSRVLSPNSVGLRELIIPVNLPETFARYARWNTRRNVETCGLLTGKIRGPKLVITDLIIPKQTGSSDSCAMKNEIEVFELQDKLRLITLGWIHTHPSQTAFLSSVDMHTHYAYELLMPEAIAIVCAPRYNQVGFFTLTTRGMEEIGRCPLSGFHSHPSRGIIKESSVYTLLETDLKVHDLRDSNFLQA